MNIPRRYDAFPTVTAHDTPCTQTDCVLPECINLKLERLKNKNTNKTKKRGRKPKNSVDQSTKRSVAGTSESVSHAQWWEEDLDDVVNILSQEISDTTHVSKASLNNDLLTFPTLPVQITSCPQITIQSDFPIFPVAHCIESDHVPNANITDSINQATDIGSVQNSSCAMDGAASGPETSSPEKSFGLKRFSRENQGKHPLQDSEREETRNTSHIGKPTSSIQYSNKLFGILSLILQAFNNPLTEELEECCACSLLRALAEIQSAFAMYNSLSDNKSDESQNIAHSS